jgi:plasmid maintenance system antidote protein VapI
MGTQKHIPFGQWLMREIENRLMTKRQFARKAGVSEASITRWVYEQREPRGVNVVRVARALGVPREEVEAHLPHAAAA